MKRTFWIDGQQVTLRRKAGFQRTTQVVAEPVPADTCHVAGDLVALVNGWTLSDIIKGAR